METEPELGQKWAEYFAGLVGKILEPVKASVEIAIKQGRRANVRLTDIENRLAAIERHVGMNGTRFADTEPAPSTQPENPLPEEG